MITKPQKTKKIVDNVYCIKTGNVNMFLYAYGDKYIAIDCGSNKEKVIQGLKELNIKKEDITHVFLTHSDYDHVASLSLFENAIVYLGHEEEQMINKTTPRFMSFRFNKELECNQYNLLLDQDKITIKNTEILAIATPGHTPGSMSYLVDNIFLFVGDALSIVNGQINPFVKIFVMDMETHVKSIEKIENLRRVQIVFSAHYGYLLK